MLSLDTRATMERALNLILGDDLIALLRSRIAATVTNGLADLTHIIVFEAGDSEDDLLEAIGMSPLVNPIDGTRYGEPDFEPGWDWLQRRGDWYEMIACIGDSGFAYVVLIEDDEDHPYDLMRLCRDYAVPART